MAGTLATPAPSAADVTTFTTVGLPAASALRQWQDFTSEYLFPMEQRVLDGGRFEATATVAVVGSMRATALVMGPHLVERPSALIPDSRTPSLLLAFPTRGQSFFYSRGRTILAHPDCLFITQLNEPFASGFGEHAEALTLVLPASVLTGEAPTSTMTAPPVVELRSNFHAASLRRRLLDVIAGVGEPTTERELVDLVRGTVQHNVSDPHDYLALARAYIGANLTDPGLAAPRIAQAVGISERHLSRIFAESGLSVPQYVREQRLLKANRILAGAPEGATVSSLARACGFNSVRHFSRLFTERFGISAENLLRGLSLRRSLLAEDLAGPGR